MRTLILNGVIAGESWFDDDITPQMFFDELHAGSGDIEVFINSPGGSVRDDLVIEKADEYGMVMAFTGMRLFHH